MNNEVLLPEKYRNLERLGNHKYQIRNKFLWWPKTIDNKTKWFCNAIWVAESKKVSVTNWFNLIGGPLTKWSDWSPIQWI